MPKVTVSTLRIAGLAAAVAGWSCPAFAHHPMGGAVPATLWQGLLSGIGHPVIEWMHLLFVLGAGLAAAAAHLAPQRAGVLLGAYAVAGALGTACQFMGAVIPLADVVIAISLMALASWLWLQRQPGASVLLVLAAVAGFFHGYAFGESVIGAETTPLAGYLLGLALVQSLLMMAVYFLTRFRGASNAASLRLFSVTRTAAVVLGAASVWSLGAGHWLV